MKKVSGKNLQKKSDRDCGHYSRVKGTKKTHANRVTRRKLNNPRSFND